eukprot:216005_1
MSVIIWLSCLYLFSVISHSPPNTKIDWSSWGSISIDKNNVDIIGNIRDVEISERNIPITHVYNGTSVDFSDYPYIVQIFYNGRPRCGGSILYKNYQNSGNGIVLTAAHCCFKGTSSTYQIRIGCNSFSSLSSSCQTRTAKCVIHEAYELGAFVENDIALMILTDAITYSQSDEIILPEEITELFEGDAVNLVGYGVIEGGPASSLQHAQSVIQTVWDCRTTMTEQFEMEITSKSICAWNNQAPTCYGDSGSAITLVSDDRTVVGIVSWGISDRETRSCLVEYPSVFTRVSSFVEWINDNLPPVFLDEDECDGEIFSDNMNNLNNWIENSGDINGVRTINNGDCQSAPCQEFNRDGSITSNDISTVGYTNIYLLFDIHIGTQNNEFDQFVGHYDRFLVYYSCDGTQPQTLLREYTAFNQVYEPATFKFPAECESITNLKIKFQCDTTFISETVTLSNVQLEGDCILGSDSNGHGNSDSSDDSGSDSNRDGNSDSSSDNNPIV